MWRCGIIYDTKLLVLVTEEISNWKQRKRTKQQKQQSTTKHDKTPQNNETKCPYSLDKSIPSSERSSFESGSILTISTFRSLSRVSSSFLTYSSNGFSTSPPSYPPLLFWLLCASGLQEWVSEGHYLNLSLQQLPLLSAIPWDSPLSPYPSTHPFRPHHSTLSTPHSRKAQPFQWLSDEIIHECKGL